MVSQPLVQGTAGVRWARAQARLELPRAWLGRKDTVAPHPPPPRAPDSWPGAPTHAFIGRVVDRVMEHVVRNDLLVPRLEHVPDNEVGIAADGNGSLLRIQAVHA